jgi:hypothetical protein
MSVALLIQGAARMIPTVILKDKIEALSAGADIAKIRSCEPATLEFFSLDRIRISIGPMADPLSPAERNSLLTKKAALAPSMRASALLFLALSYDYAKLGRIVIVTRLASNFASSLATDVQTFFPRAKIVLHSAGAVDRLYDVAATTRDWSKAGERTYLLSLGTTPDHHRDLVRHFAPAHALMGIEITSSQDFSFYPGELWIPPFGGAGTKVLYLRAKLTKKRREMDPTLQGAVWSGTVILAALDRFRRVTNEMVAYVDPVTCCDRYLYGKYPNDYSHLFCYAALQVYLKKVGYVPTADEELDAFDSLVRTA